MAKEFRNKKEEERVVSKSRLAVMIMSSYLMSSSSESDCIKKSGDVWSFGETR